MSRVVKKSIFKATALAGGLFLSGLAPFHAQADNLADALIGAYNTSGLLDQNRALLRAADEDVAISQSALRPVIDWTVSTNRNLRKNRTSGFVTDTDTSNFFTGLSLTQLIYDGGASRLNRQAAQETVLATRQALLSVEQQVLLSAVQAYMNMILTTENVTLRQNNLRVLGEELRAAQDRFDVGEVTRTDVSLAESRVAGARSGLAAARGDLANAEAQYLTVVGHKPGHIAGQPKLPKAPATVAEAENIAIKVHPQILAAQHQVSATELTVLRASRDLGPTVGLSADIGATENIGNSNYTHTAVISLNLTQNIYQGGAIAATHRKRMATRDAARANLLNVNKDVIQGVSNAYIRLKVAEASITASNEQVRAARIGFEGVREEATLGARTTLDVLTAEQELLSALTLQISARTERSVAAYQVLASQGLLTAERLGLAVQIYDPTLYYNLVKDAPAALSKRGKDLDRVLQALGKR